MGSIVYAITFAAFFLCISGKQEAVRRARDGLMNIPFEFENSGTKVIHYSPEI